MTEQIQRPETETRTVTIGFKGGAQPLTCTMSSQDMQSMIKAITNSKAGTGPDSGKPTAFPIQLETGEERTLYVRLGDILYLY